MGEEKGPDYYNNHLERHVADVLQSDWLAVYAFVASRLSRQSAIADLGCGTGRMAKLLHLRGHTAYWGVDFSPARIDVARAYVPEFHFDVGDLFDPEVTSRFAEFGTFISIEVLEHIERDRELITLLPEGSRLIASLPTYDAAAHVRHFASLEGAVARYSDLLSIDPASVAVIPRGHGDRRVFVIDGRRTGTSSLTRGSVGSDLPLPRG